MSKATIVTSTGILFDILKTMPEMICIEDIAHAGSQMNRFTGHTRFPYPVTQHERLGSYLVPEEHALRFLLHDASESYIGDMNRPLKHFTDAGREYQKVESPLQAMIYAKFDIFGPDPDIIHEIDNQMLYAEKKAIMPATEWTNKWSRDQKAARVEIVELSFKKNKRLFLKRFYELTS